MSIEEFYRSRGVKNFHEYYLLNGRRESILEGKAIWRDKNRKHFNEINKKWKKTYLGKLSSWRCNNRRRQKFPVRFTLKEFENIKGRDKNKCVYCGSRKKLTLDHINHRGSTTFSNLVLCCQSCNSSKIDKNVFDWCKEKKIKVPLIVKKLLKFN